MDYQLYIWKERDTISMRQEGAGRVQDDSERTATNIILDKEYVFEEREGSSMQL